MMTNRTRRTTQEGVMDLDLSISPDAFGLRAFDITKPLTCMLRDSLLMNSC